MINSNIGEIVPKGGVCMDSCSSFCPEYFPSGSAFIVHLNLGRIQAVLLTLHMKYYFYRQRSTTSIANEVLLLSPMQYYFFPPPPFLFARIE